jgi:aryl-alcohol dehydrogenase-like predicted oxidoreductase
VEKRRFGKTDMDVSVLGFGGGEIGYEGASPDTVARLLGQALDGGLNVIDTAECYANSEELIGDAVSSRRRDYWLFTKCGHPVTWSSPDWRPESLLQSIERSLKRLRTDRIDLVQLHSCSLEELKKGHVIAALKKARDKGWTRYLGYSGDGEAARYAIECGAFDALQISISIADQEPIAEILPLAQKRGLGVIAKRPIANAAWRHAGRPENAYHVEYWERLGKLDYDFARRGSKDAAKVALRFTLSIPGIHTAIVGTTKPERWRENSDIAAAGPLPPKQMQEIQDRWRAVAGPSWVGQT